MWPDVARRPPTLAPNWLPRKLISSANDRQAEQAADPPPRKPEPIFPAISPEHPACYANP
jgi:hypothetical protein